MMHRPIAGGGGKIWSTLSQYADLEKTIEKNAESTETRVFATDDSARRRFAAFWRVIYPGSALIRRMWLRAIQRRAEVLPGRE